MNELVKSIKSKIRTVPDFPKPGILFYDISTVLNDPSGFKDCIDAMIQKVSDLEFTKVGAIDSRGFIFGAALADRLNKGFVPIRKKGKLAGKTFSASYKLEYGEATLEISDIAADKGDKFIIIDDLLATGGTAQAACKLIEQLDAKVVKVLFLIELLALKGRENLKGHNVESVLQY